MTVGVISTGDELVPPEAQPGPGQVRDVNSPMLEAMLSTFGCHVVNYGIVVDDEALLSQKVNQAIAECDAVLLSGGSSVGVKDAACRIIESPRERLIAILTNCFVPCNGRFPTLILLSGFFFARGKSYCRRRLRVPFDCACRRHYACCFLFAEQNHTARCAVRLCSGAAAVSPPEALGCDCPQYAGQNDFLYSPER